MQSSDALSSRASHSRPPQGPTRLGCARTGNQTAGHRTGEGCTAGVRADRLLWLAVVFVWLFLPDRTGLAQTTSRETPSRLSRQAWGLARIDCPLEPDDFRISGEPHPESSQPVSRFDFENGPGSEVLVAWPIPPAWLIPEFDVELDLLPERPHARLMIRVVLPDAEDPDAGGPLTVWLEGPTASTGGRWNRLRFSDHHTDLATLLKRQIWFLRSRLGPSVTDREAYIDAVGVNLYSGPGSHTAWLGQPTTTGAIPANPSQPAAPPRLQLVHDSAVAPAGLRTSGELPSSAPPDQAVAVRNGTVIELAGQPFFARIIQHNGEPFGWLKELGFNTIQLPAAATDQQLAAAAEAGVWLVCPPPASLGLVPLDARHDRVIGWSLGLRRVAADLPLGQQLLEQLRQHDPRQNRILCAEVSSGFQAWGNLLDVAQLGSAGWSVGQEPGQYGDWIANARLATGDRIPVWADVPSEYPAELVRQVMAMAGQVPPLPMDLPTMEWMAFQSIAGGARGIRVLSRSRLDADDPQSRLRALSLRRLNQRLSVAEPWAAGGIILGNADGENGARTSALKTSRGQLLIATRSSGTLPALAGDAPIQTVRLPDRWSSVSDQAWQITDEGLVPLAGQYSVNGTEVQIDHAAWLALVVVTQDPSLVQQLNQTWRTLDIRNTVEMRRELTSQWLAILQVVTGQLNGQGRDFALVNRAIADAIDQIGNAEASLNSPTPALASLALDQADQRLAFARQQLLRMAREPFSRHNSSPLLEHTALLPQHWQLANRLAGNSWAPNGLSGGDFENLQHMQAAGWETVQADETGLSTSVALSVAARQGGRYGLLLSAEHATPHAGLCEAPPLRVHSAPVFVPANKLVRIHGWFRIPRPLTHAGRGLVIHDSWGGPALPVQSTESGEWQEFTLYRSNGQDADLRVHVILDGYGEAQLDELTVETIDLPAPEIRSANRNQ